MKPENRAFLDENRHIHDTLTKAGYMMGLSAPIRQGLQDVIRAEFQPGYAADLWCGNCISAMVILCYRYYDAFLEKERQDIEKALAERTSAPVLDLTNAEVIDLAPPEPEPPAAPPIQKKASFPSHKNHRR